MRQECRSPGPPQLRHNPLLTTTAPSSQAGQLIPPRTGAMRLGAPKPPWAPHAASCSGGGSTCWQQTHGDTHGALQFPTRPLSLPKTRVMGDTQGNLPPPCAPLTPPSPTQPRAHTLGTVGATGTCRSLGSPHTRPRSLVLKRRLCMPSSSCAQLRRRVHPSSENPGSALTYARGRW